jgi:putative Mg2+ transporter-C (MgtC) family protein
MVSDYELALRLLAGTLAGMIIGINRTRMGRGTGIRTLGLVGLGAAAATTIFDAGAQEDAAARVVQGLVTGIGFLGAGVIVRRSGETLPHGLTTAASVWLTATLGAAAGAGVWVVASGGTALAFLLLALGPRVERLFGGTGDEEAVDRQPADGGEAAGGGTKPEQDPG